MRSFFTVVVLFLSATALSQTKLITGRVINSVDKTPVHDATVIILGTTKGTFTNYLGYFQLEVSNKSEELVISHIGFETGKITIPDSDKFTIVLTPETKVLETLHLDHFTKKTLESSSVADTLNSDPHTLPIEADSILELNTLEELEEEKVTNEIFTIVEQQPHFPGGMGAFYSYIMKNMRYPKLARRMGVEGKVFVQFVIDTVGNVSEIKAIKGIGADCDSEAIRIIKESPKWQPGVQRGKPVPVRMVLPITFSLGGGSTYSSKNNSLRLNQQPNNLTKPDFPGGYNKYLQFVQKNKKDMHSSLPINKWENKCRINFEVDTLGKINDIKIVESLGPKFDQEVLRLFSIMPKWIPASINDSLINDRVNVSIGFNKLSEGKATKADNLYLKATRYFKQELYQKAVETLDKAIEYNPTKLDYYFDKSVNLIKLKRFEEACKVLNSIKELDEESMMLYKEFCK